MDMLVLLLGILAVPLFAILVVTAAHFYSKLTGVPMVKHKPDWLPSSDPEDDPKTP